MSLRVPLSAACFAVVACSLSHSAPLPVPSAVVAQNPPGPADWPQWRGQNRDGKSPETGLLKSWPKDGPPKVWTAGKLGTGFGTPSVAGGKIYGVGTRDGKDGVWALAEADGKELWFTPFADPAKTAQQNNGPASTPTYAGGRVYAVSGNGTVAAFDAATGKEAWHKSYTKDFGGSVPTWGYSDSVLIDGDKLVCAPNGNKAAVVALKAADGEVVWKADVGQVGNGGGYSSPLRMTLGDIPMYVVLLGDKSGVVGVHADTGDRLWQYNKKPAAGGVAQIPTPVIDNDRIWVSTSYGGGSALLKVTLEGDKVSVKEVVAYPKAELNNHHGGMVLVDGYVYFGHDQNKGVPACVDMKTGKIAWKDEGEPAGMRGSAAVSFADGRLYYRYQNHVLALVEPSPKEFKLVSSFKLPEPSKLQSWPHPVIANGKLYVRDQDKLHCFNIKATGN